MTDPIEKTGPVQPSPIPYLRFRTGDLAPEQAFAEWRQLMAPLFHIEKAPYTTALPRGDLSVYVAGEIMVSRNNFNAQRLWRDPGLIAATPGHIVLHYYKSGGFRGTIAGRPVCIVRGQVAVCDLAQETDAYAATSDTIGLSLPRALLAGVPPEMLSRQFDAPRNGFLGGYMATLPSRLARLGADDIPVLTAEIVAVLHRVFALEPPAEPAVTVLSDADLHARAVASVEAHLGMPDLSPDRLAALVGVSRASLYRLFAPMGGVMRYVLERRLLAVREALSDPLELRSSAQIALAFGFASQPVLSRTFRARFGMTTREWRRRNAESDVEERERSPAGLLAAWRDIGQQKPPP